MSAHLHLGTGPGPHRGQSRPPQLSTPGSSPRRCWSTTARVAGAGPEPTVHRMAAQALFGRAGRGAARTSAGPTPNWSSSPKTEARASRPTSCAEPPRRKQTRDASRRTATAGLNPRYTFDTFIVGPSNQFAACGLPRGRRSAVALVQPAVHLRRCRSRQDAPDARHWALRAAAPAAA